MTKYILHGGNTREDNLDNNSFFQELTRDTRGPQLILLNYFSRPAEDWEKLADEDEARIIKCSQNTELSFEIADPMKLAEQLQSATIMYMRGGNTKLLLDLLRQTHNISTLLDNKVIAGSSAGAYAIVKYSWDWHEDVEEVREGLGLLSLKLICHYTEDRRKNLESLSKGKEVLPVLALGDYKWVVFYQ